MMIIVKSTSQPKNLSGRGKFNNLINILILGLNSVLIDEA